MNEQNDVVQLPTDTMNPEDNKLMEDINNFFEEQKPSETEKVEDVQEEEKPDDEVVKEADKPESIQEEETDEQIKPETDEKVEETEKESEEEIVLPPNMDKDLRQKLEQIKDKETLKSHIDVFKKMEASHQKKSQAYSGYQQHFNEVQNAFNEAGLGHIKDKTSYIKQIISFEKVYKDNPKGLIKKLMDDAKIKADDLIEEDYLTEEEKKINYANQEINRLKQNFNEYQKNIEFEKVRQEIESFKNTKSEDGNSLKYPYFEEVEKEMSELAILHPKSSLGDLYEKACYINNEVRTKVEADKIDKILQAKELARKKKIEKAKGIQRQNLKSRPLSTHPVNGEEILMRDIDNWLAGNKL